MKITNAFTSHKLAYAAIVAVMFLLNQSLFSQHRLTGKITAGDTGQGLAGANVTLEKTAHSAVSEPDGTFAMSRIKPGRYSLRVSFVGYKTARIELDIRRDTAVSVTMEGDALLGEEVNIVATRAPQKSPAAFTSLTKQEISKVNLGKDIPYLILTTPSTVATSDAGNGVGYTGFSIRGTDLTRINVTINSIPLNDAESQGVWFVDLPDLASSAGSVQIQRGVGTSTNGSGAFGATINFVTSDMHQDPYGELDLSGGSFGTFKSTLRFGTGLMKDRFSVDGRFSYIRSDGYIDRAFSNLKSYYLSAGYFGRTTTLKLITFSGFERTYQAWEGVPGDSLATNRTYNPAGEYVDENGKVCYYPDQTDNYQQDHYQAIFSQQLLKSWNFNLALHYTRGNGYYENYKEDASFSKYGLPDVIIGSDTISYTDLVNRKMMDNDFFGFTFSTNYNIGEALKLTLGGAWNQYYGRHSGKVIWATYASAGNNERDYYYNTGLKKDFNLFLKGTYRINKVISLFGDLQYRNVYYNMKGILDNLNTVDQVHRFDFFNPKAGVYLDMNARNSAWIYFGIANREPSRNNYKDADPGSVPTNETLYDLEAGYRLKLNIFTLDANAYYMNYRNQLVLTGKINNVGEAVMVNVPKSYRAGIELAAGVDLFSKKVNWSVNVTLSANRIKDFTYYIDLYDADWNYLGQDSTNIGETNLSFSPPVIAGSLLTYRPVRNLALMLNSKYIGKQFIDNTSNEQRSLKGYFVNGFQAVYTIQTGLFREIWFNLMINNIFNRMYESNAWVYPYYQDGQYYEANGYFPQAPANFLFGITLKI